MDNNTPARYLDTAYNALKANPGATNQILQAAAQGAPVGLKGLAAAAAQQNQQQVQQAMAALRQQGPQPNVIQRIATQGVMSQLPINIGGMALNQQQQPQGMAGGGLVAFAGGGGVLPPDVIDAIQSHFAEGGSVRGFAEGYEIDAAPHLLPSSWTGALERMASPTPGRPRSQMEEERIKEEEEERRTPPSGIVTMLKNMVSPSPGRQSKKGEDEAKSSKEKTYGAAELESPAPEAKPAPKTEATPASRPRVSATPVSYPAPAPQEPAPTPKVEIHPEGAKTDEAFEAARQDRPVSDTGSLEQWRDQIAALRGHATMNPEIAQRLADLESQASRSTLFQTLLGGVSGGMANPYGGQFGLARAASGALGGYQQGMEHENAIRKSAFDVLRGYADAPAEEQAKAADEVLRARAKAADLASAERLARTKQEGAMNRVLTQELGDTMRFGMYKPPTPMQESELLVKATKMADDKIKADRAAFKDTSGTRDALIAQYLELLRAQQSQGAAPSPGSRLGDTMPAMQGQLGPRTFILTPNPR